MSNKKLPVGTTQHYISQLNSAKLDLETLDAIRESYPKLTFNPSLRQAFVTGLIHAAGTLQKEGWIWRTEKVTDTNAEALALFYELILTDDQLWTTLQQQTAIALQGLKFDQHLQDDESKATALDFIKFLTNSNRFANYVDYVVTLEGKSAVTSFLRGSSNGSSSSKRKRDDSDGEADADGGVATPKKKKGGKIVWYWADDGKSGHQDKWEKYSDALSAKLEKAYQKKQKTMKVDADRFVDIENMIQRRYDDTLKRRSVKREEEDDDDTEAAE